MLTTNTLRHYSVALALVVGLASSAGATDEFDCGGYKETDVSAGTYETTVSSHTQEAFDVGRAFIEESALGLGVPKCTTDNCGVGQSCEGGSMVISGSITWGWASPSTNDVQATASAGTKTKTYCTECHV